MSGRIPLNAVDETSQSPESRAAAGFTLIELLVALFIAAIMFAIGYGTIAQAMHNRGRIRAEQRELLALQTTVLIMEQDFVQLAPRPIRSPEGEGWLPAIVGAPTSADAGSDTDTGSDSDTGSTDMSGANTADAGPAMDDSSDAGDAGPVPLVQLTRGGWSNPTGVQRPELERVAYVLDHGTLIREHWNVLDPTLSDQPVRRNLLQHLRSVRIRYLDFNHQWLTQWPPLSPGGTVTDTALRTRPLAVEITLDTRNWGRIVRIFEVAG